MLQRLLKIALLFILIMTGAGAVSYLAVTFFVQSETTVIVPDISKESLVSALQKLSALDLELKLANMEYSDEIKKDHIIRQRPLPGTEIKKGRTINITISRGTLTVEIPDIRGLFLDQAKIILEEKGLCTKAVSRAFCSDIKKDSLIAQYPLPSLTVERGQCVDVLVSDGPKSKAQIMPKLIDMSFNDAVIMIEERGLITGKIKSFYIENIPEYLVLNQQPPSGHRVIKGQTVDLVINRKQGASGNSPINQITGTRLFKYQASIGFLKRHTKIQLKDNGSIEDIFDGYIEAGGELWFLIQKKGKITVYENGRPVNPPLF